jgi:hypothetical protein
MRVCKRKRQRLLWAVSTVVVTSATPPRPGHLRWVSQPQDCERGPDAVSTGHPFDRLYRRRQALGLTSTELIGDPLRGRDDDLDILSRTGADLVISSGRDWDGDEDSLIEGVSGEIVERHVDDPTLGITQAAAFPSRLVAFQASRMRVYPHLDDMTPELWALVEEDTVVC